MRRSYTTSHCAPTPTQNSAKHPETGSWAICVAHIFFAALSLRPLLLFGLLMPSQTLVSTANASSPTPAPICIRSQRPHPSTRHLNRTSSSSLPGSLRYLPQLVQLLLLSVHLLLQQGLLSPRPPHLQVQNLSILPSKTWAHNSFAFCEKMWGGGQKDRREQQERAPRQGRLPNVGRLTRTLSQHARAPYPKSKTTLRTRLRLVGSVSSDFWMFHFQEHLLLRRLLSSPSSPSSS